MDLIREKVDKKYLKNFPEIRPGDTVKVHVRIVEGEKSRIQIFEGVVIKQRGGGGGKSFTVRKMSSGVGVERIFPYNCPSVDTVEVASHGKARRAKLYYLRRLVGKAARLNSEQESSSATKA